MGRLTGLVFVIYKSFAIFARMRSGPRSRNVALDTPISPSPPSRFDTVSAGDGDRTSGELSPVAKVSFSLAGDARFPKIENVGWQKWLSRKTTFVHTNTKRFIVSFSPNRTLRPLAVQARTARWVGGRRAPAASQVIPRPGWIARAPKASRDGRTRAARVRKLPNVSGDSEDE